MNEMTEQSLLGHGTLSMPHKLRILIVDDNHINLAVLSTLLKRRFSALIEGAPVTVDSGLKAIQLLRTNVFDLILMDIQMPFLSGLDATRRIRSVEDDVLEANANAHIVAVTTAVGDEPEAAYRRAGMDGMIGKPVRFQDMHHYLTPLAREAQHAASSVSKVSINGQSITPPLPPVMSRYERLFYLPANATVRSPCPDICQGADFEKMLKAQTRASLRKSGAMAIGRGYTVVSRSPSRPSAEVGERSQRTSESIHEESIAAQETDGKRTSLHSRSPSANRRHGHGSTMMINKLTLSEQIQREMENLEGHDSDASEATLTQVRTTKRPVAVHRTSSPAWIMSLTDRAGDTIDDDIKSTAAEEVPPVNPVYLTTLTRPRWLTASKIRAGGANYSQDGSSTPSPSSSQGSLMTLNGRRDSQQSCSSDVSEFSNEPLPTPSNESPPSDLLQTFRHADTCARQRAESDSSSTTIASISGKASARVERITSNTDVLALPKDVPHDRRSFSAEEMCTLSRSLQQFGLEP